MNAVIVFMLLFAAVYCHPVKRSASSSESAEVQPVDTQTLKASAVPDVTSEEDDDVDVDDDDDSDSDESDENGATTISPPILDTTLIPIINGRGDSIGYQSGYKKPINYVDGNNIDKGPLSYKSYGSDKSEFDGVNLNLYKALQVPGVGLDQGVDVASGTDGDYVSQKSASVSSASDAIPSQESDEDSQSSEENTTAIATTSNESSESSESKETKQPALLKSNDPEVVIA